MGTTRPEGWSYCCSPHWSSQGYQRGQGRQGVTRLNSSSGSSLSWCSGSRGVVARGSLACSARREQPQWRWQCWQSCWKHIGTPVQACCPVSGNSTVVGWPKQSAENSKKSIALQLRRLFNSQSGPLLLPAEGLRCHGVERYRDADPPAPEPLHTVVWLHVQL